MSVAGKMVTGTKFPQGLLSGSRRLLVRKFEPMPSGTTLALFEHLSFRCPEVEYAVDEIAFLPPINATSKTSTITARAIRIGSRRLAGKNRRTCWRRERTSRPSRV